jgi:hypothetical protein
VYQQQEQEQEQQEQQEQQQDAENPFLDPPFSRIKTYYYLRYVVGCTFGCLCGWVCNCANSHGKIENKSMIVNMPRYLCLFSCNFSAATRNILYICISAKVTLRVYYLPVNRAFPLKLNNICADIYIPRKSRSCVKGAMQRPSVYGKKPN